MSATRVGLAAALLLGTNACAPLVVQQSARTVKPGQVQAGMSLGAISSSSQDDETDEKDSSTYIGMVPNAWARFGIAPNMDAGVQFYGGGVRVDGKLAPLQSEKMALALAAGIGGGAQQSADSAGGADDSTDDHQWWGDVGVLLTAALGPSLDLNAALKYIAGETYSSETFDGDEFKESTALRGFGGALGIALKRSNWTLSPEIAVYQITSEDTETPDSAVDTLAIVPSVGFSVGF